MIPVTMAPSIELITNLVTAYRASPDNEAHEEVTQQLVNFCAAGNNLPPDQGKALGAFLVLAAKTEAVWGLLAGLALWKSGGRTFADFSNVWMFSRFSGIQSQFNPYPAIEHLRRVETWSPDRAGPALYIIRGNAYRQLHRYSDAESAYLEGIEHFPADPFLKFRLVDLCLMTYQLGRARALLAGLRASYPYALEMMFSLPVPEAAIAPQNVLPDLSAENAEFVWLVAADPVYAEKYAVKFARTVAAQTHGSAHVHFHVVRDADTPPPAAVIEAVKALVPMVSTERTVPLSGATPNQRSALFASERFLFLAELLAKYNKPLLVTDIDVECLKNPAELFQRLGDGDIGLTRFRVVRDAWDKYPATAIVIRPTSAAIEFFQKLSGMIITLLNNHPQPWFVDQVALYRLIEEGLTPAKVVLLEHILTDTEPSAPAFFRILHGSWQV